MAAALVPIQPDVDFDVASEYLTSLVLDAVTSEHSKRVYGLALRKFFTWFRADKRGPLSKAVVNHYRTFLETQGMAPSSINLALSAIRKMASEASDDNRMDSQDAAAIARVKSVPIHGIKTGNWLDARQSEKLINAPDLGTLKGKRDRAMLALMIGCGLRRGEVTRLAVDRIQMREGRWALVDIVGKGKRVRTVPMTAWAWTAVQNWLQGAGITDGLVFRSFARWDRMTGKPLDDEAIRQTVQLYAGRIGLGEINPHDLRRTFAKLGHKGGAALEQIQLSLGHASIQTTERYLGVRQDLQDAPCDHLGLRLSA